MNALKILTLSILFALLPACGDQLVEFELDGSDVDGGTGDDPDADTSGNPDADPDSPDGNLATPPIVISTDPDDLATGVSINKRITATFDRPMAAATIDGTTFLVRQDTSVIDGTITYAGSTATFTPTSPLDLSLVYTATITTGAEDRQGNALASDHVWSFTTGACSLRPVVLNSASRFAVLAFNTVTSTGLTVVTGDLGTSPGNAVTGFGPGVVIGTQHIGNPVAAQAQADLTTAYNDAAGRTLCAITVNGDLGGMTLIPGLYAAGFLEITSGDLTLDAQGDPDAIFIFQMSSSLTVANTRQIIMVNGAKATNVYWQVGSAATIGTTASFQGTIMSYAAITVNTGASMSGRALSRTAAVTLQTNAITKPAL